MPATGHKAGGLIGVTEEFVFNLTNFQNCTSYWRCCIGSELVVLGVTVSEERVRFSVCFVSLCFMQRELEVMRKLAGNFLPVRIVL